MPTPHISTVDSAVPPWAVQQRIGTAAARYALNSMLMPRTDAGLSYTDYRSGVMAAGDGDNKHLAMQVTAGDGMNVQVAQGNAVVNTPNQGAYMCALDSEKTVAIPASSSTTTRYDLVVGTVYDDNNSALAGQIDRRAFAVEIVQGDPSTGRPVVPAAPVGSIPLASVYVGASVSDLTGTDPNLSAPRNSAIQDKRGPGIVSRGAMRPLYGEDTQPGSEAYDAPGAYPGDQRWVHHSGFQHQVYYGQSQGWRGVFNALVYNANAPQGSGINWRKTIGQDSVICQVTIPDPGTPYMLYPTARINGVQSRNVKVDYFIRFSTGVNINWVTADYRWNNDVTGAAADREAAIPIPPIMFGPNSGERTIQLVGRLLNADTGYGWGINESAPLSTLLSVTVFPSTVQPPSY